MRRIIVGEHVSLDGVMEAPEKWSFPFQNEETGMIIADQYSRCDALLLGRVTFQTFADAFSSQRGGMADIMNGLTKYVVSDTLQKADWQNSVLIKGNVVEEIAKLKRQPGKDIGVSGAGNLLQTLIEHDLVDEYTLLVYPIVLGSGKRLFREGLGKTQLKLAQAKPLRTGVVHLSFRADGKGA